ncbi:flavin reductase family protein [Nocardia terpenica]|uniref:Oxidoreductase n=1 Tax=Nocardia terpenica TaxID=455432 RepID=A0A291RGS9_9NOCA|nr:flavin reductase family protein [Nocardia terpenica]ATL66334.1 oxidoreductase [Nocardia terpenica]
MNLDARELRTVLGHFSTGITVVGCRRGDRVYGATVNSFTAVSLDPPLVLVALDRASRAGRHLGEGDYVINILSEHQRDLALHFAGRPMRGPIRWSDGDGPTLADTLGHLVCEPWRSYDGGDHLLHVGRVREFELRGGLPLLFYRSGFHRLRPAPTAMPWHGSLDGPANVLHIEPVLPATTGSVT